MSGPRTAARLCRLFAVLALGAILAGCFASGARVGLRIPLERRQRWTQAFLRRLARTLPFEVRVIGELPSRPMLWVSNHVSWTDIPLLGRLTPLSFLSKAEVRDWPLAGWLAKNAGTLFIRRGGDSQRVRRQIIERLGQSRPLLIFPEGTTTDGSGVRAFHGRLLGAAIDAGTPIQPVAIQYLRHGCLDPVAPFIGEDDLVSHLLRLFAQPPGEVVIRLLEPLASTGKTRAALAFEARQAILQALSGDEQATRRQPCAA